MESKELAEYIDQFLEDMHPNFQWQVVKNSGQHIVEVFFTFKIDVAEDIQVQDSEGTVNEPGVLQFEDAACFYDPSLSHVSPNHYLRSFIFDTDKGIEQGLVDAIFKHLNIVATQGSAALREFVKEPTHDQFELSWNETNFEGTLDTLKDTGRYSTDLLQMNVKKEVSLIDQIK